MCVSPAGMPPPTHGPGEQASLAQVISPHCPSAFSLDVPWELAVPKGIVNGLSGPMVLGATSQNLLGLFPALPTQAFGRQRNKIWGSRPSPSGDWLKGLCQGSGSGTSCWHQGRKCVSVHACVCGLSVSVGRQGGLGVGRSGRGEIPQPHLDEPACH